MELECLSMNADWISQMPEHIIHHILSFLPTRDTVRLSVLSKIWYRFFTSFPIFDICEPDLVTVDEVRLNEDRILEFANFVYSSLLRQHRQHRSIPKFNLTLTRYFSEVAKVIHHTDLVDRSVGLCMQDGVKELSLNIQPRFYRLPEDLFPSRELSSISYPSLREFSLEGVSISNQEAIKNLNFTCPFLEKFALINCLGLCHLKLFGFTKLKKVKVIDDFNNEIQKIEIDHVLSLQSFSHRGAEEMHSFFTDLGPAEDIDLTGCRNLEVLILKNVRIADKIIRDLDSKFPALKVVVLQELKVERIEISSPQLEKLVMDPVVKAVINAPRLQSFQCFLSGKIPSLSLSKTSSPEIFLKLCPMSLFFYHGSYFLEYLREYLQNFDQINLVTVCISSYSDTYAIHEAVRTNPVLLDISHLKLKFNMCALGHHEIEKQSQSLVDNLFCICHPGSLLVESGWRSTGRLFMKGFCKELVNDWQDDLDGIKIEHFERNGDRRILTGAGLLDSLHTLAPKDKIRFVFKW